MRALLYAAELSSQRLGAFLESWWELGSQEIAACKPNFGLVHGKAGFDEQLILGKSSRLNGKVAAAT